MSDLRKQLVESLLSPLCQPIAKIINKDVKKISCREIKEMLSSLLRSIAYTKAKGNRVLASAAIALVQNRKVHPLSVKPWIDADKPIEEAATPPSQWYTNPSVLQAEEQTVFSNSWLVVGQEAQLQNPGDYITGQLLSTRYVVCRGKDGQVRAFHNVCRHHAAAVANERCGHAEQFTCPYHGWTYGLDGRLTKATKLKGIRDFRASEYGLLPLEVDTWGPFVFIRPRVPTATMASSCGVAEQLPSTGSSSISGSGGGEQAGTGVVDWLGEGGRVALAAGVGDSGLVHVASRTWKLSCNWKVFCDNYLDGGYHVPHAHPGLAAGLDLGSYRSTMYERLSIQSAPPGEDERLASSKDVAYVFVYPNLMINRYGPWMDTNVVLPLGHDKCEVQFEYYLDERLVAEEEGGGSQGSQGVGGFVSRSLEASAATQEEDVALCEAVQAGLGSPAYDTGRYAPGVEPPMFHFHRLLHQDLQPHYYHRQHAASE